MTGESVVAVRCSARTAELLPHYASARAAGADLRADLAEPLLLAPGGRARIPTGLRMEIPAGYEGQVRPRSGLAHRHGVTLLNSPGTIDADYRGEIAVILINLGDEPYRVAPGERIAQFILAPTVRAEFRLAATLEPTERAEGGFGSTGR